MEDTAFRCKQLRRLWNSAQFRSGKTQYDACSVGSEKLPAWLRLQPQLAGHLRAMCSRREGRHLRIYSAAAA